MPPVQQRVLLLSTVKTYPTDLEVKWSAEQQVTPSKNYTNSMIQISANQLEHPNAKDIQMEGGGIQTKGLLPTGSSSSNKSLCKTIPKTVKHHLTK